MGYNIRKRKRAARIKHVFETLLHVKTAGGGVVAVSTLRYTRKRETVV